MLPLPEEMIGKGQGIGRNEQAGTKKPLRFRGLALLLIPLISRNNPPELAPFLHCCKWVAGLRRAVSLHLSG